MATLPNVPPSAPPDFQISVLNQVIDYINQQQRTQIINDGTNNRMIFGYQQNGFPGGSFGMKISSPGKDVTTAAYSDLLFYWDFTTGTQYWNNSTNNYMQIGTLPDGSSGWLVAKPGLDVKSAFTG